jgi:hypothetical protein
MAPTTVHTASSEKDAGKDDRLNRNPARLSPKEQDTPLRSASVVNGEQAWQACLAEPGEHVDRLDILLRSRCASCISQRRRSAL